MSAQTLSPVLPSPSFTPPAPLSPFPSSASQAADDYTDLENLNSLFLHLDASLKSKKKEVDGKVEELRGMRALDTLSDANTSRIDLDLDRLTDALSAAITAIKRPDVNDFTEEGIRREKPTGIVRQESAGVKTMLSKATSSSYRKSKESSPPLNDPRTIKPKPKDTYFHSVLTYYKSVLSSVSLFLTSERHTILTRCTSTVGTMGGIDRRASNAQRIKGGKRRESTCLIHALPTMAGYLNEFVVKTLLDIATWVFSNLCTFPSPLPHLASIKWSHFDLCCKVSITVPTSILTSLCGSQPGLVTNVLLRDISTKWNKGVEGILGDQAVAVSMRVCVEIREHTGGWHKGDETEGDDNALWKEVRKNPKTLVERAGGIGGVLKGFEGLVSLCKGEEEEEEEEVETDEEDLDEEEIDRRIEERAATYVPKRQGVIYVWLCTVWNELRGFLDLLNTVKKPEALLAVEKVRRSYSDVLVNIYSDKKGWAEGWNDGVIMTMGGAIKESEVGLARWLFGGYLRTCNTIVLPGVGGIGWGEERNYMGASRVSTGVAGWVGFVCEVANDCKIMQKGGVICKEVFGRVLKEGVRGLRISYLNVNPSRVMLKQWKVDVIVLLKFVSWFIEILKGSFDNLEDTEEDDFWAIEPSDDEEVGVPQLARPDDADCIRSIMQSVKDTTNDCSLLIWVLAMLCGDGKEVFKYAEEALKPLDPLTPKSEERRKSNIIEMAAINFDKLLEGPMLWAMFAPQKLTYEFDKNLINVLKVNGILCGGQDEKNIFNKISTLKLPWGDILDTMGSGAGGSTAMSPGEVFTWIQMRHEIGDWSFPKLTPEEEEVKIMLVDLTNKNNSGRF